MRAIILINDTISQSSQLIAEQSSKRVQPHLVVAALLAGGAGHVGDGAPGVNDQRELLRGRPDVQPRRVVPEAPPRHAPASRLRSNRASKQKGNWGKENNSVKKRTVPTRW